MLRRVIVSNSIFEFQCVFRAALEFTSNFLHRSSSNYTADQEFLVLFYFDQWIIWWKSNERYWQRSLDLSEYKKGVIEILNVCPHCFKFHIKLINFSIWLKDPQKPDQNLKLLMCYNQKTENASEKLSSSIQFSNSNVFFGLFWNSPLIFYIEADQIIEPTWNFRCWIAIWAMRLKKSLDLEKPCNQET